MGSSDNSKSTLYWTVVSGIVVALISALGAYYSGGAAKEREISATQTAEIRILTLTPELASTPYPTNTPHVVESTRVVTVEVTRIVEVESTPYPTSTVPDITASLPTESLIPASNTPTVITPVNIIPCESNSGSSLNLNSAKNCRLAIDAKGIGNQGCCYSDYTVTANSIDFISDEIRVNFEVIGKEDIHKPYNACLLAEPSGETSKLIKVALEFGKPGHYKGYAVFDAEFIKPGLSYIFLYSECDRKYSETFLFSINA